MTTSRPRNNIPLAAHWTPPAELLLPVRHKNDQFEFIHSCQIKKPTRSHSRRTSSSANCLQVIKLSIHPSKVGMDPGSLVGDKRCGSGDRAVSISMLLSIASGVLSWLKRRGQLGEGRSREKTTEFVDRRRYRGVLKNKEIYAPDDNSIKRQIPKINSRDKGMDLGTRERVKRWEFGKVKLRVVKARCATLHASATHRFTGRT